MKDEMANFVENYDAEDVPFFGTSKGGRGDYFLKSGWKMKPFYEKDSKDENGELTVPKS